jgi:hypothetical protein
MRLIEPSAGSVVFAGICRSFFRIRSPRSIPE